MNFDIVANLQWLWNHIWAALKQMGGVAILTAVGGFIIHKLNLRFEKRLENKYDERIERLKTQLDSISHAQKNQFDTEFSIYQELCAGFSQAVNDAYWLFPSGLDTDPALFGSDETLMQMCIDRHNRAIESFNKASKALGGKAAFIDKKQYDRFSELHHLLHTQLIVYNHENPYAMKKNSTASRDQELKAFQRTGEITQKWNDITDDLRNYIVAKTKTEATKNG